MKCQMVILLCCCIVIGFASDAHALVRPKEPLHRAAQEGNLKEVQKLINQEVDVNKLDEIYGCTALHMAAMGGHLDVAKALRKTGAKIYAENKQNEPLVFAAVSSGNVDLLKFLLAEGASSKSRNAEDENLLHHAITCRKKEMVLYLIDIKVDVNAKDKKGYTPLHAVTWIGDLQVTNRLVAAGGNVNGRTNRKETPLHTAVVHNHVQVVKDLIAGKADCNLLDESGRHALFSASSLEVVDLLLKAGAKPDISDRYKYTPLSGAVVAKNGKDLSARLIKAGADVNRRIDHGRTAIFNVIPDDRVDVFAFLVKNGADLNIKSDSGETPLDWVKEYKATKIKGVLEKRNSNK